MVQYVKIYHINRMKKKKRHMTISTDAEKVTKFNALS